MRVHILHSKFSLIFILAVLALWCFVQAFSSCGEQGFAAVMGLLTEVLSLVAEHRF